MEALSNKKVMSRRALLRGGSFRQNARSTHASDFHLPWTSPGSIVQNCSHCDLCLSACPENVIIRGDGGFPTVDFKKGECSFCQQCAKVCPEPVFDTSNLEAKSAWTLHAVIGADCLALNGVQCQSCQDHCDPRAIGFSYANGSIPQPTVSSEDCTGCGGCVSICPTQSINVTDPQQNHADERTAIV